MLAYSPGVGAVASLAALGVVDVVPAVAVGAVFDVKGTNRLGLGVVVLAAPPTFPNKLVWLDDAGVLEKNDNPGVLVVAAPGAAVAAAPPNKLGVAVGALVEGAPVAGAGAAGFPKIFVVGAVDVFEAKLPNKLDVVEGAPVVGVPGAGVVDFPNNPPDNGMLPKMFEPLPVVPKTLEELVDVLVVGAVPVFPAVAPKRPLPEKPPWLFCGALMAILQRGVHDRRRLCRLARRVP